MHPLDMDNHTTLIRFKWLRQLMPLAKVETLRIWSQLPLTPITVVVTTCSKSADGARKRAQCRKIYAAPFFVLRFARAASDTLADVSGKESFSYPSRLAGDLFAIRRHIEATFFISGGFLVISDD